MTFPAQKSFGEFVADRYGPKWVYAQRSSERIARQYPNAVVITPKQQRQLSADYKREWGAEYDPARWKALCVLRQIREHLEAGDDCRAIMLELARGGIEALTT